MEQISEFIRPELMVLVPVLYFIGMALKRSTEVTDKWIPLILGACGILLSSVWIVANTVFSGWRDVLMGLFAAFTQGILIAGCSVYVNQLYKQGRSDE